MRVPVTVLLFASLACSGSPKRPAEPRPEDPAAQDAGPVDGGPDVHIPKLSGPARLLDDRYFVDEGAPHPQTCSEDKDCIGDTVPDATGCCVRSQEAFAQTWAWHTWIIDRRLAGGCTKVTCPPVPPPTMPKMCRLQVRCVARVCVDGCSEEPEQDEDHGQEKTPQKK